MRIHILTLLCLVTLFGCKKDVPLDQQAIPGLPDGPGTEMLLVAGDTTDMIVMNHDLTLTGGGTNSLHLDLDGVTGNEITFITRFIMASQTTSPGSTIWFKSAVPELEFIGYQTHDTILRLVDSSLAYHQGMEFWIMHVTTDEGCDLGGGTTLQVNENVFRPMIYSQGSQMDTLAALPADSVLLFNYARTYNSPFSYFNDSTALKNTRNYRNSNCFGVPMEEVFYIGFVLNGQNGPRHGFLCLERLDWRTIKVHYTAIEP